MMRSLKSLEVLLLGSFLTLLAPAALASGGVKIYIGSSGTSFGHGVRAGGHRSGYHYSRPYGVHRYRSHHYGLGHGWVRRHGYYARPYLSRRAYNTPYAGDYSKPYSSTYGNGYRGAYRYHGGVKRHGSKHGSYTSRYRGRRYHHGGRRFHGHRRSVVQVPSRSIRRR